MRFTPFFLAVVLMSTLAPAVPLIVAHRGASFDAPENTMAAFNLAWEQQADAIEGDFWLTADGHIVAMHDRDTKRTTAGAVEREVVELTLEEVRRLDVGSWKHPRFAGERPPTLREVLASLPDGKLFFIEVKDTARIVPQLKQDIEASGVALEQLRLISFDAEVVRQVGQQIPGLKRYWLTSFRVDAETGQVTPTLETILQTLAEIGADGLDCRANLEVLTPAFVAALRDAGYEWHVWTVNDADVARRVAELGVDSITTDRPAFIRDAVRSSQAR